MRTPYRLAVSSLVLLVLVFCTTSARAGDESIETTISGADYGIGLTGGYGVELGDPPELDFVFAHPYLTVPLTGPVGGGSFYRGVLEYKAELDLGLVDNYNGRGEAGVSPVGFRYNFTAMGGRLVPYVEGMLGAVYINIPKKVQGTRFNFIESAGLGVRYFITGKTSVEVQARYRHLSNAGIRKPNPGINTGILLVGISYY